MPEPTKDPPVSEVDADTAGGDTQRLSASGASGVGEDDLGFLAQPGDAPETGRLGHYRILKKLGKGGMGLVLLAEDTRLNRKVALKVMLPKFAADRPAKERFLREARTAAAVKHDHIVTIYQVDEDRGVPFIALEYLKGQPLDVFLKENGPPDIANVLRIGREVAEGLAAAHEVGLIHRDIKPANIWLEAPNGRVKILDFGLARLQNDDAQITGSGTVMGTPAFMSPEQGRGEKIDHRADLFSLGALLYSLCTGKPPFGGSNVMAVLTSLAIDKQQPAHELNPRVPPALSALIDKLLAKNPAERPQSASEVAVLLRNISQPSPGTSGPMVVYVPMAVPVQDESSPWEDIDHSEITEGAAALAPPSAPPTSRRWPLIAGIGGALVLAGVAFIAFGAKKSASTPTEPSNEIVEKKEPQAKEPKAKEQPRVVPLSIFDDKNLAGWITQGPGNWEVKEGGELVGTRKTGVNQPLRLQSERTFGDFTLAFRVRIHVAPGGKGEGNYGGPAVWLRAQPSTDSNPSGPRVNLGTHQGDRVGKVSFGNKDKGIVGTWAGRDQFAQVVVTCIGKKLTVRYNGTLTFDEECDMPDSGHIVWHFGGGVEDISVRDVRFFDFSQPADPSFFNGKDLTGWECDTTHWRVENGIIVGDKTASSTSFVTTRKRYTDFELSCTVRHVRGGTNNMPAVIFRVPHATPDNYRGPRIALSTRDSVVLLDAPTSSPEKFTRVPLAEGEDARIFMRCVGKKLTLFVNGQEACFEKAYDLPAEGVIGFMMAGNSNAVAVRDIRFIDLTKPVELSAAEVLTSSEWEWSKPANLTGVNSPANEYDPAISADGLCLIFTSDRDGVNRLYESRRANVEQAFENGALLETVCPPTVPSNKAWLSGDGLTLLLTSIRPGGSGNEDIWISTRANREAPWEAPTNLKVANSSFIDDAPALSTNGLTLYFSSNRQQASHSDIWSCFRPSLEAPWGKPGPVRPDVNTRATERWVRPFNDGSFMFNRAQTSGAITWHLAGGRPDGTWEVRTLSSVTGTPNDIQPGGNPTPSADGKSVYFLSGSLAGGRGKSDLWVVRRVPKAKPVQTVK